MIPFGKQAGTATYGCVMRPLRAKSGAVRTWALGLVGALIAVALFVAAGLPLYVFPRTDAPERADLLVVLGPPTPSRIDLAERMMDEGYAKRLIVSVRDKGWDSAQKLSICRDRGLSYDVGCFVPDPFTTQGEARTLRRVADRDDVKSVIVVTTTPHVTRARLILERCFAGKMFVVSDGSSPSDLWGWADAYAYQTGALVKAAVDTEC